MKKQNVSTWQFLRHAALAAFALAMAVPAHAQTAIEAVTGSIQGGVEVIRIDMSQALNAPPAGFAIQAPARIALDFPGVTNGMGRSTVDINQGNLKSVNVVQAGDRTRVVLNLKTATAYKTIMQGKSLLVTLEPGVEPVVSPIRTGRFQWLMRDWTIPDADGFAAACDRLLGPIEPSATLLQLSLAGIVSLSDRIAILGKLDNDLRHRLRHLAVMADDLVGRPSEQDLADLRVEGMIGTAAAKLMTIIDAGGSDAVTAKRALERLFVEYQRGQDAA